MRSSLRHSILSHWMIPLVYVAATLCLAFIVPRAEYRLLPGLSHQITVSSAMAIFSSIASGMIALTAIVFSLAFVMVQFTGSAYSPRLVFWFSENPRILHCLGIFSATFIYALATLGWVDREASGRVPFISTWIVVLLLISSMLALVELVHGLSELEITKVLHFIGDQGRRAIKEMYSPAGRSVPKEGPEGGLPGQIPGSPVTQTLYFSGGPLVITSIEVQRLVHLAREAEGLIVMRCAVGDALMEGAAILQILGGKKPLPESDLLATVKLGPERTFDQDPKYAVRLLVDVAIKALSPAINDPTTAVQALDQIEDLLRRLATCDLDTGRVRDEEGTLRLYFPTPPWEDYLSLAFDEISFYGATSVQVMRKLRSALNDLVEMAQPARKEALLSHLEHLNKSIDHSFPEEQDRLKAKQEDRQGLGLTSRR